MAAPKLSTHVQRRIGKALLQFFKPVQIPDKPSQPVFKLLFGKKKLVQDEAKLEDLKPSQLIKEEERKELEALAKRASTHWLDLVLHLLAICKKTSLNIRNIVAIKTYRRVFGDKGKSNLKMEGGIINMTTTIKEKDRN